MDVSIRAQEYAIKKTEKYIPESYGDMRHRRVAERFDSYDIEQAYQDGAQEALASQWVSVEDALPEPMQRVLVWIGDEALVCWYTKSGRFKTTLRSQERYSEDKSLDMKIHLSPCREDVTDITTHWLNIPPLNPEKE